MHFTKLSLTLTAGSILASTVAIGPVSAVQQIGSVTVTQYIESWIYGVTTPARAQRQ